MSQNLSNYKAELAELISKVPMLKFGPDVDPTSELLEQFVIALAPRYGGAVTASELWRFIYEELDEIDSSHCGEHAGSLLKDILSAPELDLLVSSVLSGLENLPKRYTACFQCPQLSRTGMGQSIYNADISSIDCINADLHVNVPTEGLFGVFDRDELDKFGLVPGFYFRIRCHGLASSFIESSAIDMALRRLKVVLAVLIAEKRIRIGFGVRWSGKVKGRLFYSDNKKGVLREVDLPYAFRQLLGKIELVKENAVEPKVTLGQIAGLKIQPPKPFDFSSRGHQTVINFNRKTDLAHIQIACEWIIDAIATDHSAATKALLISAALESILSEGERIDSLVTEKLADRCAYALSMTLSQRKLVRTKFKEFYGVRSRLVHGSGNRLTEADLSKMAWAQSVVFTLIDQEIRRYGLL